MFSLFYILFSNALASRKDMTIFYSRSTILALLAAYFICYANLFAINLEKGIGLYGGIFNITSLTQGLTIYILLISSIILVVSNPYLTLVNLFNYYTTAFNFMLWLIKLTSYIIELLVDKLVPVILILYSMYVYMSYSAIYVTFGWMSCCLLSFTFMFSNLLVIYLVLTNKKKPIKLRKILRNFLNLISQPYLLVQLFILLVIMYIIRYIIISSSVPEDNRSIIIIFYVVISLLPVPPFYFTIIGLMENGKGVSVCDFCELHYNSCQKNIQGSTILYIFISIVFVRMVFIPLFYTFPICELGITFLSCATVVGAVFIENYNHEVGGFGLSHGLGDFNSASPNPGPNPGGQDLLLASSNNSTTKDESDQDSMVLNPSTQKICPGSLERNVLENIKHDETTDYCILGWNKIKHWVVGKDLTALNLAKQMLAKNVTCYDIFKSVSIDEGFVATDINPLNLSQPNPNLAVYNLSRKLANLVSSEAITRTPGININKNHFVRLTNINYDVSFDEIKGSLTDMDVYLLTECIKANKGYYRFIGIKHGEIEGHAFFLSRVSGFKVINTLNEKGLFKYLSKASLKEKGINSSHSGNTLGQNVNNKLKFANEGLSGSTLIDPTKQKVNSKLDFIVGDHDLSLVLDPHNHSERFCEKGLNLIQDSPIDKNIPYSSVLEKMGKSKITCGNLFQPLPCENGLVQVSNNKLNLDTPNVSWDVYQLAKKIAIVTSNFILSKPNRIEFNKGSFSQLVKPNRTVLYSDISHSFSLSEKTLFYTCVSTNPTHYSTIELDKTNLSIKPDSKIMSNNGGYKVSNAINQLGILQHQSFGKMNKELHKLRQNEMSGSVQAESSTSNKRKLSATDLDSSSTTSKRKK